MSNHDLSAALGLLAQLYDDPEVVEILVDSPVDVFVDRGNGLVDAGVRFASSDDVCNVIDATLEACGAKLVGEQSIADVRLDQDARMLAVFPPTAPRGPYLVIRKLLVPSLTWEKLLEFGAVSQEALDVLQSAVRSRQNILVSGGTGSGKTTVANLLAGLIPSEERLAVVEAAHELQIRLKVPHPRAVFLEVGSQGGPTIEDLISTASKMRPDWLIIGELLGPEAMRALEVLSRGHNGITTLHANSPEDALARLEAFCLMANLGLGLGEIRTLIASAIQVITCQRKLSSGARRITHIVELSGLENERYVLQPLFRYNPEGDRLEATGIKPSWSAREL